MKKWNRIKPAIWITFIPVKMHNYQPAITSLKTDYIWINDIETFEDARNLMEYAFTDYNTVMPHSSIGYLPPGEFEGRWNASQEFREEFLEKRKAKHERDIRRREEKKRRLKENVSLEDELSVQN